MRRTGSGERLVDGAVVDAAGGRHTVSGGDEPERGHVGEQVLGLRLDDRHLVHVEGGALDEEAVDVAAVLGALLQLAARLFQYLPITRAHTAQSCSTLQYTLQNKTGSTP